MIDFTTETHGLDTFMVCELPKDAHIDTMGLGMLKNNRIKGLVKATHIRIDDKQILRYNVSSQISLKQFFLGKVNKNYFLTVLKRLLTTIEELQDYMLDPGYLLLNKENIYINVGTLQTEVIYYPVLDERVEFHVESFVKNMIIEMEFDESEDGTYITKLINFLNKPYELSVKEIKEYIAELLEESKENEVEEQPVTQSVLSVPENVYASEVSQQMPQTGFSIPNMEDIPFVEEKKKEKTKKNGLLTLFKKKPKKKADVEERVIDTMNSSTLPEPPKPIGVSLQNEMVQTSPSVHQPMPCRPATPIRTSIQYGESELLKQETSGETTVLRPGYNTMQRQRNPYLIRKKTNEKIEINKDIFRIGKEKTYADYWIFDNSAVSRSHADIIRQDKEFYIVDNNSLNHTLVSGVQIESQKMIKLENFTTITMADEIFEFCL